MGERRMGKGEDGGGMGGGHSHQLDVPRLPLPV